MILHRWFPGTGFIGPTRPVLFSWTPHPLSTPIPSHYFGNPTCPHFSGLELVSKCLRKIPRYSTQAVRSSSVRFKWGLRPRSLCRYPWTSEFHYARRGQLQVATVMDNIENLCSRWCMIRRMFPENWDPSRVPQEILRSEKLRGALLDGVCGNTASNPVVRERDTQEAYRKLSL